MFCGSQLDEVIVQVEDEREDIGSWWSLKLSWSGRFDIRKMVDEKGCINCLQKFSLLCFVHGFKGWLDTLYEFSFRVVI